MEGLEVSQGVGFVGEFEVLIGVQFRGGEAFWEVEKREVEKVEGIEEKGRVEKFGVEREDGVVVLLDEIQGREENEVEKVERKDSEGFFLVEIVIDEEKWEVKMTEGEELLEVEKGGEVESVIIEKLLVIEKKLEGLLEIERKGSEMLLDQEKDGEGLLDRELKIIEILLDGEIGDKSLLDEIKGSKKLLDEEIGGEGLLDEEVEGSKKLLDREVDDIELFFEVDKILGVKDDVSLEE